MIPSAHHAATQPPRNAELQAVAATDRAAREKSAAKDAALSAICDGLFMTAVNGQPAPSVAQLELLYEVARLAMDGTSEQARGAVERFYAKQAEEAAR